MDQEGEDQKLRRYLKRSLSGTKIVSEDGKGSLFDLPEPKWTPSSECPSCANCNKTFDFRHRRHHCRYCGLAFCAECAPSAVRSLRQGFIDPVPLCAKCLPLARFDNELVENHLARLTQEVTFTLADQQVQCHLSQNHRFVLFKQNKQEAQAPLDLCFVVQVEDVLSPDQSGVEKFTIFFMDGALESKTVLALPTVVEKKQASLSWTTSFKKALVSLHGRKKARFVPTSPNKRMTPPPLQTEHVLCDTHTSSQSGQGERKTQVLAADCAKTHLVNSRAESSV